MTTVVLFSGGMDSTICLLRNPGALALTVDYGQPSGEIVAARHIAAMLGCDHVVERMLFPVAAWTGFDPAFRPGRNVNLLTMAACHGDHLIIGATAEDQEGFPDCRPAFFVAMGEALSLALGRTIGIAAPLVATPKRDAWRSLSAADRIAVRRSVSCYQGKNCGDCSACLKRKAAMS